MTHNNLDKKKIPQHIAIAMDGNGRWGIKHGMPRTFGHQSAIKNVKDIIRECANINVKYLTLYAFSIENWNRPQTEVEFLFNLFTKTINTESDELIKNNAKIKFIGSRQRLPVETLTAIDNITQKSINNTGISVIIALNYSSKWETQQAIKNIIVDANDGVITQNNLEEDLLSRYLETKDTPNPDLFIRTGGEYRLSNFLLYQMAYTELYFTQILWPDFTPQDLHNAIIDYQSRTRRFGSLS